MVIAVNSDFTIVSALVNPAPEWERVMMDQYTRVELVMFLIVPILN